MAAIASAFIVVNLSEGSMMIENAMGKTTDILLATVVTEIPASAEDFATRKNIIIKRNPIRTEIGIQGLDRIEFNPATGCARVNPSMVATR